MIFEWQVITLDTLIGSILKIILKNFLLNPEIVIIFVVDPMLHSM